LGSRKGIRPVKNLGGVVGVRGAIRPVGVVPTRTVGASASIILLCFIKIQRSCFFWYWPTRVVPDQRPLNGTTTTMARQVDLVDWLI